MYCIADNIILTTVIAEVWKNNDTDTRSNQMITTVLTKVKLEARSWFINCDGRSCYNLNSEDHMTAAHSAICITAGVNSFDVKNSQASVLYFCVVYLSHPSV